MNINSSVRQLAEDIRHDLGRKLVVITGARQAGKTTLARQLMADFEPTQYLNWDVPADRTLIAGNAWSPKAKLVVFDEIHKMKDWKTFLKGAWDGRSPGQAMLVTGSARMDTFRQGGESLAGRYFNWRLHPFSVRELVEKQGISPAAALALLQFLSGSLAVRSPGHPLQGIVRPVAVMQGVLVTVSFLALIWLFCVKAKATARRPCSKFPWLARSPL